MFVATVIEVILVSALLVGFKYADRIAEWEQGVMSRVKAKFNRNR